jgi:hypothetical protein
MTGCRVAWKCRVACRFGESSQHPTWPQVRHKRRCTQREPIFRHSSHPSALGVTSRMAASLSRPVSSSALITSCRHPFALQLMMPHGALASLRGRRKPPHDGMRRMGGTIFGAPFAADQRQGRRPLRTHPTRRPRGDIFLPEQNALSPCRHFLRSPPPVQATVGAAVLSLLQRNSLPSTHIRCRTTARRLATATMARRIPRR